MTDRGGGSSIEIIEAVQISKQISWFRYTLRLFTLIHYSLLKCNPLKTQQCNLCLAWVHPPRDQQNYWHLLMDILLQNVPFSQASAFAGFCWVSPGKLARQDVSNPQGQFLSHLNQEMCSCVKCLTQSPGYKGEWENTTPAQRLLQHGTQWYQLL